MNTDVRERAEEFAASGEALLARLAAQHQRIRPRSSGLEIELYHRASLTLRVGLAKDRVSPETLLGRDDGVALRGRATSDGRAVFAACSGSDAEELGWALRGYFASAVRSRPEDPDSWPESASELRRDLEPSPMLPLPEELERWLRVSGDGLSAQGNRAGRQMRVHEAWVEVTLTIESWVSDRGGCTSRSRERAWTLVRLDNPPTAAWARPVILAGRTWSSLSRRSWTEVLQDRWLGGGPSHGAPSGPQVVVFGPEASSALVQALVRVQGGSPDAGSPVGPGWCVADDPHQVGALFGGEFDDAGFPTRSIPLADGRSWVGRIRGRGHYRRPSFRDLPVALPSEIVVVTESGSPPARGVLATQLSLHPLGPAHWVLDIEGATLEGALPLAPVAGTISIAPDELVRRCVGAVGPSRSSYRGVRTPALVFDGLRVHSRA